MVFGSLGFVGCSLWPKAGGSSNLKPIAAIAQYFVPQSQVLAPEAPEVFGALGWLSFSVSGFQDFPSIIQQMGFLVPRTSSRYRSEPETAEIRYLDPLGNF